MRKGSNRRSRCARLAAADGCRVLVATPHQRRDEWANDDPRRLADRLAEVALKLPRQENATVPQLLLGAEVRVDSELLADLARPERAGVLALAGSRYLLLEFEPHGVGPDPVELVHELLAQGWEPIVAHPEVVPFFWENDDALLPRLVEAGALFQVTAMSITGEFGKGAKARAWELLRAGCVSFVASDSHRPDWRPPGLGARAPGGRRRARQRARRGADGDPSARGGGEPAACGRRRDRCPTRRPSRCRRPMNGAKLLLLAAFCSAVLPGRTLAQATPDSFYLSLLRDGKSEMLRGDAVAAKKSFRLACFGFLEQPVILAEGLVRLGLAQAALGDRDGFVESFTRLAEVDERFAAYAPAALSAEERRGFENKALEWIAPETLRASPAFAALLARKSELDLAKLAPRERTRELEKRLAAEPDSSGPNAARWKVLLAQDEAANDRMAKVLLRLEGVPDAAEGDSPGVTAGCLRGRALARLKRCDEATVALATCATLTSDALLAEAQLTCLATLERPDAARELAARLTRPAADAPAVRKAIARLPSPAKKKGAVKEGALPDAPAAKRTSGRPPAAPPAQVPPATAAAGPRAPSASPPQTTPAAPAASPPGKSAPRPAAPQAGPGTTRDDERAIATARGLLKAVDNRDELRRGLEQFRPVADRNPGRGDLQLLAGEIAYRAGLWAAGADYFRRASPDRAGSSGPSDPTLRFYFAVCLYEAGDHAGAAQVASTGLEKLQHLPFVDNYLAKIRAARP